MLECRLVEAPTPEAVGTILRNTVQTSLQATFQELDDTETIQRT
jgi:hypothetical protein